MPCKLSGLPTHCEGNVHRSKCQCKNTLRPQTFKPWMCSSQCGNSTVSLCLIKAKWWLAPHAEHIHRSCDVIETKQWCHEQHVYGQRGIQMHTCFQQPWYTRLLSKLPYPCVQLHCWLNTCLLARLVYPWYHLGNWPEPEDGGSMTGTWSMECLNSDGLTRPLPKNPPCNLCTIVGTQIAPQAWAGVVGQGRCAEVCCDDMTNHGRYMLGRGRSPGCLWSITCAYAHNNTYHQKHILIQPSACL